MAFSEATKLNVKKKADFTCCWCRDRRNKVEVHHIIPQAEGGSDDEDNAAPLCGSCHDLYGGNPELRKEITLRRDQWYELCLRKLNTDAQGFAAWSEGSMTSMQARCGAQPTPNLGIIRQQLNQAFDDPGLDAFCQDYFGEVYNRFGRGLRKDEKITLLLDHCRRVPARYRKLLSALKELAG